MNDRKTRVQELSSCAKVKRFWGKKEKKRKRKVEVTEGMKNKTKKKTIF